MSAQPPKISMQDRLQKELAGGISSGTISESDENALSDAIDAIDEAMRSDASSTASPSSPEETKAKIQSLIDEQVEAGTLTSEQADELSSLFENAAPQGDRGAPPPNGGQDGSQALDDFLSSLRAQSTTSGYGASGSASTGEASALVYDTTA